MDRNFVFGKSPSHFRFFQTSRHIDLVLKTYLSRLSFV